MNFGSFLIGAACGASAATVVFLLPSTTEASRAAERPPLPTPPVAMAPPPARAPANVEPLPARHDTPPPAQHRPAAAPASTSVLPVALPPAAPPIALSAEHAELLKPATQRRPPTLAELHEQLSAQPKDPAWAPDLEQTIRQAIAAADTGNEFELMSVECRTSLCEVLAFGNLPNSGQRWNQLWDGIARQPAYADHVQGNSTSVSMRNDRHVIVTMLHRKKH